MITSLTNTTIDLGRSGLLNIKAHAGLTVACESGLVWVTVEGERTDHWLVAGDALSVAWPGRVVIEAAQASRVALREPEKSIWKFLAKVWPPRHAAVRGVIAKENMA
jgi:hypothetical protein